MDANLCAGREPEAILEPDLCAGVEAKRVLDETAEIARAERTAKAVRDPEGTLEDGNPQSCW